MSELVLHNEDMRMTENFAEKNQSVTEMVKCGLMGHLAKAYGQK